MIKYLKTFWLIFLVPLLLISCQSKEIIRENSVIDDTHVANSIIIFIHGDGDYLFHNKDGEEQLADEAILQKSIAAAKELTNSEVFIFHQKKKESSLIFFSENNLISYHYKNGKLKNKIASARNDFNFNDENLFYKKFSSPHTNKIVLYYGHEIPLDNGYGYSYSNEDALFNISIFADVLTKLSPQKKINLVVLSTCNNGSPEVMEKLKPITEYVIASPENLHLSYMNPLYIKKINTIENIEEFSIEFARSAFYELKNSTETITAISVYKMQDVSEKFLSLSSFSEINQKEKISIAETCDCGELTNFNSGEASKGVLVFFNPPTFGKQKYKLRHSGWGCRKEAEFKSTSVSQKIIQAQQFDLSQSRDQEK